jgi:amino acid permease
MCAYPLDEKALITVDRESADVALTTPAEDDDLVFSKPIPGDKSMFSAFIVLLQTAIGSGTLMIPLCFCCGLVMSLIISTFFAFISWVSMHFLISAGQAAKAYDYHGLFDLCFGRKRRWMVDMMIFLVQLGALMIYCHWNGKLFNRIIDVKNVILGSNQFWIFFITSVIVFPMTILRRISALDSFSAIATLCLFTLIINAAYWLVKDVKEFGFDPHHAFRLVDLSQWNVIISALAVNCMAFNCHINLFSCLEHLRNCTARRARITGGVTIIAVFMLYNMFGVVSYLDKFRELEKDSAIEHYDASDPMVIVATVGVIMVLLASGPLVCWGARNSLISMIWKDEKPSPLIWVSMGFGLCAVAALLAASSDDVILFFDLVGGIFCPVLVLLLPALFYLKCVKNRGGPIQSKFWTVLAWVNMVATVISIGVCGYQAVAEIAKAWG